MGMMFQRPVQPLTSEDTAKTWLLRSIYSNLIGPMQTQTMGGNCYIIMFTNDYSTYTKLYFLKLKLDAAEKFEEHSAWVEKQQLKSKVCRITVDGGGEYGSRVKFLDYLAQEGITSEVLPQTHSSRMGYYRDAIAH